MSKHYLAVYGTLRKGQPFYEALEDPLYIATVQVGGFRMYDRGGFPTVEPVADKKAEITCDLLLLNDHDALLIAEAEMAAGFKLGHLDSSNWHIWLNSLDAPRLKKFRQIISGDWVSYRRATRNRTLSELGVS